LAAISYVVTHTVKRYDDAEEDDGARLAADDDDDDDDAAAGDVPSADGPALWCHSYWSMT
jgi:hypothetical protein